MPIKCFNLSAKVEIYAYKLAMPRFFAVLFAFTRLSMSALICISFYFEIQPNYLRRLAFCCAICSSICLSNCSFNLQQTQGNTCTNKKLFPLREFFSSTIGILHSNADGFSPPKLRRVQS